MKLQLGMTVTFTHRHTYKAPAGQPLTGVVTGIERNRDNPNEWDVSVYSEAAEAAYGMRPKHLRAASKAGESAATRLANLERANAARIAHHSVYPVWKAQFDANPAYSFFPETMAAVRAEIG